MVANKYQVALVRAHDREYEEIRAQHASPRATVGYSRNAPVKEGRISFILLPCPSWKRSCPVLRVFLNLCETASKLLLLLLLLLLLVPVLMARSATVCMQRSLLVVVEQAIVTSENLRLAARQQCQ